jgi:hypothetical protein
MGMAVLARGNLQVAPAITSRRATWTLLSLLVAAATVSACDSCQRDRPYTPFRIDASAVPTLAAPSASQAPSASPVAPAPSMQPTEGRKLEPPIGRFELGGRTIELPKELLAERLLERPSAQAGQTDALVWVVPAKPDAEWNGPMGELWQFAAGRDARRLLVLPGWMPSGPGCVHESRLAMIGKATFVVDVHARCDRSLPQRTPNRALVLVNPDSQQILLLGLRIAEAAADESLAVTAVVADRDGDGREDPSFHFEFAASSANVRANADLGWLDRAAGASVDEGYLPSALEPTFLAWEGALGKKPKLATVLPEISATRRLLSSLCQQSSVPRVFAWDGTPLRCPSMLQTATRLARIEVRASLSLSDPLEAARALAAAVTWHGGIPAVERDDLQRRIAKSVSTVKVGLPVPVSVRPTASAETIHYSPLMFETNGAALLVQLDGQKLERVTLDGASTPVDADAGVTAWPLAVTAPDGRRWSSVVPACDRSELSLALKASDGALLPLIPTRLLAPRPGVCRNPAPWPIATGPIAWQGEVPMAIVDGVCLPGRGSVACPAPANLGPVVPGSPRSPDGRRLIVVTTLGAMVIGGPKPELWTGASLDGRHLRDCVVANDAKAIACVADTTVLLLTRPEPVTPK